jgi:hypothetical protein
VLFISSDRVSVWSKETDESLVVDIVFTAIAAIQTAPHPFGAQNKRQL